MYFLQLKLFRCALFIMMVLNRLKYDWNQKGKYSSVQHVQQVCHIGYITL